MAETKTAEEIYEEMKARFEKDSGCALTEGGDMQVRLYAAAAQLQSLYIYNDWVRAQCFPQTARGEYLDYHAQMRGLSRNQAEKATGSLRFSIDEELVYDVPIPAGTVCRTVTGLGFVTNEDGSIPAGELSCDVACEAEEAGAAGNVPEGTIVYMVNAPVGVSACENRAAFSGGADEESDEELRARVLASFKTLPNGANAAYYEKEALSVNGVAAVTVLPKNRGLGTVDIVISAEDGLPSQALLTAVRDRLEDTREICCDIRVSAPETVEIDISAAVTPAPGVDSAELSARVSAALSDYFGGGLLGKDVLLVKLGSIIYSVDGVENYVITSPSADVYVDRTELPVLGTVEIVGS